MDVCQAGQPTRFCSHLNPSPTPSCHLGVTRGCGCSDPGDVQDQVGWGPGHPELVNDIPTPSSTEGLEVDDL